MAYTKLYYPPTANALQKTLDAALDDGITASLTLNNVTSIQNKPGVVLINRIDTNSVEKSAALREYVIYTAVSGSTLTGLTRGVGGTTDQDHAVGSVVEFIPDITWAQAIIDFLLVEHSEADGTHSAATIAKLAGAQTFTGAKTFTTGLLKAVDVTSGAGVSTFPTSTDTLVGRATTDTLTSKRITKRVQSVADAATITPNADNDDVVDITAIAQAFTIANPSGTPTNKQLIEIEIKDNGTARAITWGNGYVAGGTALPTTTILSKILCVLFQYSTANTLNKWRCIGTQQES